MQFDVIVIGAGAAGMMCAAQAGQRGRRVLLLDHAKTAGERIRISGGGRCNFTNRDVSAEHYLSQNPDFCRSALARFSQYDFIALVERYRIPYHEREHGQLFCDESARDIIAMLKAECAQGSVKWALDCTVEKIARSADARFVLSTGRGTFRCQSLVIASGGLAVPQIGATPFGYKVAEQFGVAVVAPKPALVPLALAPETLAPLKPLAGSTMDAATGCNGSSFRENLLITHRGLSGPAILQISSYWQMQEYGGDRKQPIAIDLLPGVDPLAWLASRRNDKTLLPNLLAERLPRRFAHEWCALSGWNRAMNAFSNREIEAIANRLTNWELTPSGTLGYAKAEVTLGGVDTRELSSRTLASAKIPGLYFIGEVVDVTGWLGGYNFQWAWSSGWVAGQFA